jgi:hypothetical protein
MANQNQERLSAEEFLCLQEMFGNGALMSGLRKIVALEERSKLDAMRSEALGHGRAAEIVKYAAESRTWAEWEQVVKSRMDRHAPQS